MPQVPAGPELIVPKTVLDTESMTLQGLLSQDVFEIPRNQRAFSWNTTTGDEQISKLWGDIRDLYYRNFPDDTHPNEADYAAHFMGTIVLISDQAGVMERREVIDGQQRLVSMQILLSVLVDLTNSADERGFLTSLLFVQDLGARRPRVLLNEEGEFFVRYFIDRTSTEARAEYWNNNNDQLRNRAAAVKMRTAEHFLRERIGTFLEETEDPELRLTNLMRVITKLLLFIRIELRRPNMAYQVFETLNARGLDLTQSDLIKNELLRSADAQMGAEGSDHAYTLWSDMRDNLDPVQDSISITEFLHFQFVWRYGDAKKNKLFEAIQKTLSEGCSAITGPLNPIDYAANVESDAARISQILEGDVNISPAAAAAVAELKNPLGMRFPYSFLMASRVRFAHDDDSFGRMAELIRNFAFRRLLIGRAGDSAFTTELITAARMVSDGDATSEDVAHYFRGQSPDAQFRADFSTYSAPTHKIGFYILKRIEDYRRGDAGVEVIGQNPSQHLEHILPKSPGQGWAHTETDERAKTMVNRLGNLLVLEGNINTKIRNSSFAFKVSNESGLDYEHSQMLFPHELADFLNEAEQWTPDSIEERQQHLAEEYACDVWPLLL